MRARFCPTPLSLAALLWSLIGTASFVLAQGDSPHAQLSANIGQLSADIDWQPLADDSDQFYMVQRSRDGRIFLTPNESFFPKLGLTAQGKGRIGDVAGLNGGNSFDSISGWDPGEAAEWGIWLERPGDLELHVWMSGGGKGDFELSVDGKVVKKISAPRSADAKLVASVQARLAAGGRHLIHLTCSRDAGKDAQLHWIEVSGAAVDGGAVLRKRWRPAAAHTKFTSSRDPKAVRMWVMEMDAVPGELDFYAPLTSPFGYYGPTWKADGRVNTSFNFSLWSFGRGEPEPPVNELSHLIAIGNRDATFGHFDHEGTGVKIRDWEPLDGRQEQSQAFALRVEPGETHDTYFSYFYAADEKRWRLFGVGKKNHKGKSAESLWVGSFVEVPGPPPKQRTGPYERRMRYRGWVMDDRGKWFALDRMQIGNIDRETGLTHTDRGLEDDGWFALQTGGWTFRKSKAGEVRAKADHPRPEYLDEQAIEFLKGVPCSIEISKVERADSRARVSFDIAQLGENAEVLAYWGKKEGLTMVDRWSGKSSASQVVEGDNQIILEGVPEDGPLFVRMFLRNDEGQFWSMETTRSDK